jgi:hypothetical protein
MPEDNIIRIRLSLKGRPIKSFSFNKDVITVGRDPSADVCLDNPSISREHLRIERMANGHFCVKDPGSANGVYLNEERVTVGMVYNNDVVRIGKFSLWISVERDRRVDERNLPKVSPEASPSTMMLTTDEIQRIMTNAREREMVPPEPPISRMSSKHEVTISGKDEGPSRVKWLVGIGLSLIVATSLGAWMAWLFLR